jgi:hypothetical protein
MSGPEGLHLLSMTGPLGDGRSLKPPVTAYPEGGYATGLQQSVNCGGMAFQEFGNLWGRHYLVGRFPTSCRRAAAAFIGPRFHSFSPDHKRNPKLMSVPECRSRLLIVTGNVQQRE